MADTGEQTDVTQQIFAFRNVSHAPKNNKILEYTCSPPQNLYSTQFKFTIHFVCSRQSLFQISVLFLIYTVVSQIHLNLGHPGVLFCIQ
jgi:hypothetical protein